VKAASVRQALGRGRLFTPGARWRITGLPGRAAPTPGGLACVRPRGGWRIAAHRAAPPGGLGRRGAV